MSLRREEMWRVLEGEFIVIDFFSVNLGKKGSTDQLKGRRRRTRTTSLSVALLPDHLVALLA